MKRLTVEMVQEALDATGYKLKQNITLDTENGCGCPIGIRNFFETGDDSEDLRLFGRGLDIGLSPGYSYGFTEGFDQTNHECDLEDFIIGYADGELIRKSLLC